MLTVFADGGELTAGRRTAAYVYGSWNVQLPDGAEKEERPEDKLVHDAFVARVNDKPKGRFGHTFTKGDVNIDMESRTTDIDIVLDDAFTRTDGDMFFQREIEPSGLNGTIPYVDYNIGDVVRVGLWNTFMELPVTGITTRRDDDGGDIATPHVGGELISDRHILRKNTDDLRKQIAHERAETRKELGYVNDNASAARDAATAAGNKADKATDTANQAGTKADTASTKADTATKTANTATDTANQANAKADTATDTANQANAKADSAVSEAQRAKAAADDANKKSDNSMSVSRETSETVKRAVDTLGATSKTVSGYVEETKKNVATATQAVSEAKLYSDSARSYYDNVNTTFTNKIAPLYDNIKSQTTKAGDLVAQVKQVSKGLDPKVAKATQLLADANAANSRAIELNTQADNLRDQSIKDLSDAGKKLTQSQENLSKATAANTDSIGKLNKAQEEHLKATSELGTATQALAKSTSANASAINALNRMSAIESGINKKFREQQTEYNTNNDKNTKYFSNAVEMLKMSRPFMSTRWVYNDDIDRNGYYGISATNCGNMQAKIDVTCKRYKSGTTLYKMVSFINVSNLPVAVQYTLVYRIPGNGRATEFTTGNTFTLNKGETFKVNIFEDLKIHHINIIGFPNIDIKDIANFKPVERHAPITPGEL